MSIAELDREIPLFREINLAKLAERTGGASRVSPDETIALWSNGGVRIEVQDEKTQWNWRGDLRLAGFIIPDSAVLFETDDVRIVFPAAKHDSVQGFCFKDGRIRGFETFPASSTDPLRIAATSAMNKLLLAESNK